MTSIADLIDTIDPLARKLLLIAAVHEAGHCVIGRVVGLRGGSATLRDENGDCYTWCDGDGGIRTILTALAGRAATEELLGWSSDATCESDDATVAALLEARGFDPLACRDTLLANVRDRVRRHVGAVALVALHLIGRVGLSGDEIDRLLTDPTARKRSATGDGPRFASAISGHHQTMKGNDVSNTVATLAAKAAGTGGKQIDAGAGAA
jgi:hypothetical protein